MTLHETVNKRVKQFQSLDIEKYRLVFQWVVNLTKLMIQNDELLLEI